VAAQSGRATLEQFQPLRTADPEIRRLMAATQIRTDRVLGPADYPSLEVVFHDGRSEYRDVPFAKGAPEAPMSDSELNDKAMALLEPVLGGPAARALADAIWSLEDCQDAGAIVTRLAPAHKRS